MFSARSSTSTSICKATCCPWYSVPTFISYPDRQYTLFRFSYKASKEIRQRHRVQWIDECQQLPLVSENKHRFLQPSKTEPKSILKSTVNCLIIVSEWIITFIRIISPPRVFYIFIVNLIESRLKNTGPNWYTGHFQFENAIFYLTLYLI
jgi:hypothetical protein